MFKSIRLLYITLFLLVALQQHSFGQIINERKMTGTPFVSILQSSDNEYIYVGSEGNPDRFGYDVTLTKKDINGDIKWKRTIEWDFDCTVRDAAILSDDNIIIAGSARKSIYESYPFIMKTDPNGDTLWTRYYQSGHQAEKVIGTSDGGYLFAYYSDGSGLMKLNADGDSIWSKIVGNGRPYGLTETTEAVYLLVDNEDDNIVLSSIDSGGDIIWKRILGGTGVDQPADVINASNGDDYLVAGSSFNKGTGHDFYIGFLNCFGYTTWTKTFGGPGTDLCLDLMESSDGGFIAVGSSNSFNNDGRFDFYAVKFDRSGNTIWTKTFPAPDNENYIAQKVYETSYGSYLVAGQKPSGSAFTGESYLVEFIYPARFDLSFESDKQELTSPPFEVQFFNTTLNREYYDFVWHFGDGESLVSNDSIVIHEYREDGIFDVTLVAYENDFGSVDSLLHEDFIKIEGISTAVNNIDADQSPALHIHPNPFTNKTIISFDNPDNVAYTLRIIDQNGKLVKAIDNIRGSSYELSRDNLPSGIYYLELSGKTTSRARLVID